MLCLWEIFPLIAESGVPMDEYTEITKVWLENRYAKQWPVYFAHEPIYGIGNIACEPHHARRIVRLFQLLRAVRDLGGRTLLDVGGSEGYFAYLCKSLFGMDVMSVDLSREACRRAAEIFTIPGAAIDSARLPFANDSFDVVTCAEVVEHLSKPIPSILELQRVAKHSVILATEEWLASAEQRDAMLASRRKDLHGERSFFADCDARALFYPAAVVLERQLVPDERRFGNDSELDLQALHSLLINLADQPESGSVGVNGIVVKARISDRSIPLKYSPSDEEIAEFLLEHRTPLHRVPETTPQLDIPDWCTVQCANGDRPMACKDDVYSCPTCDRQFSRLDGIYEFFCATTSEDRNIESVLQRRGGECYETQLQDLLELESKLSLEFFDTQTAWCFSSEFDRAQWEPNADLQHSKNAIYQAIGPDPQLISPWLGLDIASIKSIDVVLSVLPADELENGFSSCEIFYLPEGCAEFTKELVSNFDVEHAAGEQRVRIDVPHSLQMNSSKLLRLRFDPPCISSGVEIVRFEIVGK